MSRWDLPYRTNDAPDIHAIAGFLHHWGGEVREPQASYGDPKQRILYGPTGKVIRRYEVRRPFGFTGEDR